MILIDVHGHMVTDNALPELHAFASFLGLEKKWFQEKRIPHYDLLSRSMKEKAMRGGAKLVDSGEIADRAIRI